MASQTLNGVLLPVILVVMLRLINDRRLMGQLRQRAGAQYHPLDYRWRADCADGHHAGARAHAGPGRNIGGGNDRWTSHPDREWNEL